jgi:hypothetical protein
MPQWWYMANAVRDEWPRVVAWHQRRDPETGLRYSWLEAMWATADNPPSLDRMWDETFGAPEGLVEASC